MKTARPTIINKNDKSHRFEPSLKPELINRESIRSIYSYPKKCASIKCKPKTTNKIDIIFTRLFILISPLCPASTCYATTYVNSPVNQQINIVTVIRVNNHSFRYSNLPN